ncbi:HAD family hydrolase [Pseudovibrio exalbescens]|uniref:HAD family hydrolase n=1 Tax=Pseudovibrio exalbescens TaxID=197461 RepID=UPI002365380F|nr:HAD family hydrolase [Pseudovibrio exalbescens]MDD7911274.1 HAD family hydrolase [Pseudovibrio exalbescens]
MVDLIIWDCDGCLIDSEHLSAEAEAECLREVGLEIDAQGVIDRFTGMTGRDLFVALEAELGRDVSGHPAFDRLYERVFEIFERELQAVAGVHEALAELDHMPMAIASGASHRHLKFGLSHTGLYDRFEGKIVSAQDVARGKPAPDVFLRAAELMKTEPNRCLVIEDSPRGMQGAHAAGMHCFGFTGATHGGERLHKQLADQNPVLIFDHMHQLPGLFAEFKQ